MRTVVVTAPQAVVSLEEAKRHLRVDFSDDDVLITGLVAAATANIDGPAGWLGRAVGVQLLEATRADWACGRAIELPFRPIISVASVKYLDADGVEQTIDPAEYRLVGPSLLFVSGYSLPSLACEPDAVRIRYWAGYGTVDTGPDPAVVENDVPAPIKLAIMMMAGAWYQNREAVAAASFEEIPLGAQMLLSPFRIFSL